MTSQGMTGRRFVELERVFVARHPESRSASNKPKFYVQQATPPMHSDNDHVNVRTSI